MPDTTQPDEHARPAAPRLKGRFLEYVPNLNKGTREAFPGMPPATNDPKVHTVTINGVAYLWTDATADTVPEEAIAIYQRSLEANA